MRAHKYVADEPTEQLAGKGLRKSEQHGPLRLQHAHRFDPLPTCEASVESSGGVSPSHHACADESSSSLNRPEVQRRLLLILCFGPSDHPSAANLTPNHELQTLDRQHSRKLAPSPPPRPSAANSAERKREPASEMAADTEVIVVDSSSDDEEVDDPSPQGPPLAAASDAALEAKMHKALRQVFGLRAFRPPQMEVVKHVLKGGSGLVLVSLHAACVRLRDRLSTLLG